MLSLSLCLNPYHSSTSLSVTQSPPPHGYVLFGQACVLAYMSWRLLMFTITNWDQHTDVRGPGTETKKGNGFSVMQCWNQRDIHNWWTTFAALLYWPAHEAPGNEPLHITHRANEEEKRARQNREMKRSSDYLNKSFWVETQTILTEAKKIFPFFSFRVHNKLSVYVTGWSATKMGNKIFPKCQNFKEKKNRFL